MKNWEMMKEMETKPVYTEYVYEAGTCKFTCVKEKWGGGEDWNLAFYRDGIRVDDSDAFMNSCSDWEEVDNPYTFKEAYDDCLENDASYENREYSVELMKNALGNVVTILRTDSVHNLNGKWYKK